LNKSYPSPIVRFVENYSNKKSLGEQHFIGVSKRDEALKEKEVKAAEIVKNAIYGENDPKNELYDNFGEFSRMSVNLIEEEILYEELEDYQGSTYPEHNVINKKQSTPSQGNKDTDTEESDGEGEGEDESDGKDDDPAVNSNVNDKLVELQQKSISKQQNLNIEKQESSILKKFDNEVIDDSMLIISEIMKEDSVRIQQKSVKNGNKIPLKETNLTKNKFNQSKGSTKGDNSGQILFHEKEVPLLTKEEREEYESILDTYDYNDKEGDTFVLTPIKNKNKLIKHTADIRQFKIKTKANFK